MSDIISKKLQDSFITCLSLRDKKDPEPFDISEYEFSHKAKGFISVGFNKDRDSFRFSFATKADYHLINKQDVIAMAKALGVTGGDL